MQLLDVKLGTSDYTKVINMMFGSEHGSLGQSFVPVAVQRIQNVEARSLCSLQSKGAKVTAKNAAT